MHEMIKRRRKELGLTQEQVAGYLGVSAPAVHKWEKGISYPDVTLLPALARLLKIDLNTLFAFEKELSPKEISLFLNGLYEMVEKEGFKAAYRSAMEKVREYPNCGLFLNSVAAFLDGMVLLYEKEEPEKYMDEIEELYERAVQCSEGETKDMAVYMLLGRCLRRGDFDGAEELWEKLPNQKFDKEALKANILIQKKEYEEAAAILEKKLWYRINDLQNTLLHLTDCYRELGEKEKAELCCDHISSLTDEFGLMEHLKYAAEFQKAVEEKEKEEVLTALENLLESMKQPYHMHENPLFTRLSKNEESVSAEGTSFKQMASAVVTGIRKDNGLDGKGFLEDDKDLEELLKKYE